MSFLNDIKPNKPTTNLEGYFISMLGKSKFGKTSFAIDLIEKHYKGDMSKGLLIATEKGFKAIKGVYPVSVTGFDVAEEDDGEQRGFIEVVDELVENKDDISFRFIVIDTITALERQAIQYVIRKANRMDSPEKRYVDLSDILWGKGHNMVGEEIYSQIEKLINAGFGVFVIGHEKTKKIKNRDGFEYDYTGFNVGGKTSEIIEREADMIIYGDLIVEKDINDNLVTNRKLRFRSDGNILCGTRFKNFPDEIDHDVDLFLETFENAVLGLYDNDETAVKKAQEEESKNNAKKLKTIEENRKISPDAIKEEIDKVIKGMTSDERSQGADIVKDVIGTIDYRKSDDSDDLTDILNKLKNI